MSGSVDAKKAWVERVLGFQFAPPAQEDGSAPDVARAADALDLKGRLQAAGGALRGLRDASAPEAAGLAARYAELVGAARTDPAAAAAPLAALESDIARATAAARGREAAPAKGRGVVYRKLLLRWREAQGALDANLKSLGAAVLAQPEIQADPRIEEIKQAVAELPKLVPQFGGNLEDVLDAGMNASEPAQLQRLAEQGIAAIDAYRQQLQSTSKLLELEQFAAKDLGASLELHSVLDQALVELKQQLAA
jgi:hypothetical protein